MPPLVAVLVRTLAIAIACAAFAKWHADARVPRQQEEGERTVKIMVEAAEARMGRDPWRTPAPEAAELGLKVVAAETAAAEKTASECRGGIDGFSAWWCAPPLLLPRAL